MAEQGLDLFASRDDMLRIYGKTKLEEFIEDCKDEVIRKGVLEFYFGIRNFIYTAQKLFLFFVTAFRISSAASKIIGFRTIVAEIQILLP